MQDRAPAHPFPDPHRAGAWVESAAIPLVCMDRDFRWVYVNRAAEALLQERREDLLGRTQWEIHPLTLGTDVERAYRHTMDTREPVDFEQYYPPHDRWYRMSVRPAADGMDVEFHDITAERRRAVAPAAPPATVEDPAALDLLDLITETSTALSTTLEVDEGVRRLARLVVPRLADWVIVSTYDATSGALDDVAVVHRDPELQHAAEVYAEARTGALAADSPARRAIRSGRPEVVGDGRADDLDSFVAGLVVTPRVQQLLTALQPGCVAGVPLLAGGRTVGLLSLFRDAGSPPWTDRELRAATDVAARAGTALDNARLFTQQRQVAEALQRSLLTDPPEPDHAEIVVRYLPAVQAARVGGDWYDAFVQPGRTTMVVIGDVAGHDIEAAAAMGQLRSLLRGIAVYSDAGPAEVLSGLDRAMDVLAVGTIATAAIARFEQTDEQRRRGVTSMRWSSAGHPPPLVLDTDGRVTTLGGRRADLLLGVDPATTRTEHVAELDRDTTVFLHTDGLIEQRGPDGPLGLDAGLDLLRAALADLAHLPLGALCDAVIERLVDGRPDDDVALVAVRLHRQDRPRPAEAGPGHVPDAVPAPPGA
ncbi:SpoIIE family protein phosphatase [Modestobacter sp. VKM Ac-2984]|uniref:SpoIIE family protein phosphatase n=1 Tax=Modestobacter sp. VKM Ac-2984 TaxID=3004138 RepID=UPI0022AA975F|nr:SpoIIE family protein phosphatase [Modestobacter sp. VKM Ac-2984]MCZ2815026.1 SpoIIE family protein phosphatase [Modestobacter sp. VKM Ac-2984]